MTGPPLIAAFFQVIGIDEHAELAGAQALSSIFSELQLVDALFLCAPA
jgi:hypothetical protein